MVLTVKQTALTYFQNRIATIPGSFAGNDPSTSKRTPIKMPLFMLIVHLVTVMTGLISCLHHCRIASPDRNRYAVMSTNTGSAEYRSADIVGKRSVILLHIVDFAQEIRNAREVICPGLSYPADVKTAKTPPGSAGAVMKEESSLTVPRQLTLPRCEYGTTNAW